MIVPVLEHLFGISLHHASGPIIGSVTLLGDSLLASTTLLTPRALPPPSVLFDKYQPTPIRCEDWHFQVILPIVHAVKSRNFAVLLDIAVVVFAQKSGEHWETEGLDLGPTLLQVVFAVHDEELVRVLVLLVEVARLLAARLETGGTCGPAELFVVVMGSETGGVCVKACTQSGLGGGPP